MIAKPGENLSRAGLSSLLHLILTTVLHTVAPICGICLAAGVLANVATTGARPHMGAIKPDFKKLNPATGAKNLFGTRAPVEALKSIAKVGVVGAMAASALIPQLRNLAAAVGTPPAALAGLMKANVLGIAERVAIAYIVLGVADYVYQRRRHNKSLKMTKQEVKEEAKSQDLPPEVRGAIRRRQMQAARARMMAAVPQADVVVTNPTHYAVALMYDGNHPAPIVVAKGMDHVAFQIRRIAEENGVPVVPDPPLARSLHAAVEVDQMIPAELYAAVAQVLAFVYRMAGRKKVETE
jgi:flagellar biosynthetic protein FlhB